MKNLALLTDFYQLTMMNGYLNNNIHKDTVVFDMFFRKNPCDNGFTIIAGIEQMIEYIENLKFTEEDLDYIQSLGFDDLFINELRNFKFSGTIYGVKEGSVMFPGEPIIRVKATCFEAQLIETAILNIVNFQSLIATKASRICTAAKGDSVFEFGLRRAQGPDAGIYGARAAVIGGCSSTSNVLAGKMFDIPVVGTQAHSWIQTFDTELEAFRAYAKTYPDKCMLLVDTYDTIQSGVPNAITVFNELRQLGYEPRGIRIDSGDLAYLSKRARKMLDEAGFPNALIVASSDLDEDTIHSLKIQGAVINGWGVGTNLITSKDCPALGGVYKLAAVEKNNGLIPKIKISENPEKITNPGYKKVVRIYEKCSGKAQADLIMLEDEIIERNKPLTIFHPVYTWKKKVIANYEVRELLIPIFEEGILKYKKQSIQDIQNYVKEEISTLWPEYLRLKKPEFYKVDLSKKLWDLKQTMVNQYKESGEI
ncbi:nicotinate phosphoribosyltransferase [Serpentinicella alkaliphila]|uniref:Nicotinate phosphoribosyltransferase n=1 Tax=Serpentinicella alkaliphila TaxID=1734049 RepID=A0A4R2TE35_9FIRM|nr:nicotinate phosphoribosyltransferase [Serpentinicella alkaliphila]QUH25105.1 nicotinate phosphoribosyltransferase [Serpentinicella alkaliphila]TCQ01750.1 nicotinate phosphoribosyltransferase [Serpentinicella alkaliphila]